MFKRKIDSGAHRVNTEDENLGDEGFIGLIQSDTAHTRTHLSQQAPWPEFTDTHPGVPGELHVPRRTGSRRPDPRDKWATRFMVMLAVAFLITLIAIGFAVTPHQ